MRPRHWIIVGLLLVALVGSVAALMQNNGSPHTSTPDWFDPQVSEDGLEVTVSYTGGACDKRAEAEVQERSSSVTITVIVTERELERGEACPAVGIERTVTARLSEPLGDRKLLDGWS